MNNTWISVKDRLPKDSVNVVVYVYNKMANDHTVWVSHYWDLQEAWYIENDNLKVTHWQELPEPPKEKETHEETMIRILKLSNYCEVSGAELPTKKIEFYWEPLDETTARAKVIGGWVLATWGNNTESYSESMVFIPDPAHEWEIEE